MSERDRGDEPAPGHWRVTATPLAATPATPPAKSASIGAAATFVPAAPAKTGGRPLLATLICVGLLAMSFAGQPSTPMESGGPGSSAGYVIGGALFGAILWGIAFAITIRKASTRWKAGSLILVALLGGLVALSRVVTAAPAQIPVVRTGK